MVMTGGLLKYHLNIYRALIRSTIDYGCIVYGKASKTSSEQSIEAMFRGNENNANKRSISRSW